MWIFSSLQAQIQYNFYKYVKYVSFDEARLESEYRFIGKGVNVDFIFNTTIEEFLGQDKLEKVRLKDTQTGETKEVVIDGVFIAIGHNPNKDSTHTSVAGVLAAGDVTDFHYRQGVTAAGSGCKAALDAEEYLEVLK